MGPINDPYELGALEEDIPFVDLLQAIIELMDQGAQAGNPNDYEWLKYAHFQVRKVLGHLLSLLHLRRGTELFMLVHKNSHIRFLDHSSAAVLSRTALEGYLLFYKIFVSPSTEEEKTFLIKIWSLGNNLSQRKRPAYSAKSQAVIQELENKAESLIADIKQSPLFELLNKHEKKAVINKGDWKLGKGWPGIAEEAGFPKEFFKGVYAILSDSAHSGQHSIHVLQGAVSLEQQLDQFVMPLRYGLIILSRMIKEYPKLFQHGTLKPPPQKIQETAVLWRAALKAIHLNPTESKPQNNRDGINKAPHPS